jgi:hypothetical protein
VSVWHAGGASVVGVVGGAVGGGAVVVMGLTAEIEVLDASVFGDAQAASATASAATPPMRNVRG